MFGSMLSFENCTIGYDQPVIKGLDLEINRGDFVSIVGPTGKGKSTIIRCLSCVDEPATAPKIFSGRLTKAKAYTSSIVFQSLDQLLPWKTVLENTMLPILSRRVDMTKAQARERGLSLLDTVGLSEHVDKYPCVLSGGMRQRVAIARAMLCSPELMLMDEPFASLDAITRVQLQDMIKAIQASYELTIIFVTHDIGEALKLSNKLLVVGRDGSCQTIDGPALSMLTESDITKMFGKSKDI